MVTLDGFCKVIKEVALVSGLPIIADADTGFGEGEMCSKTVWEYYLSGASGIFIINFILFFYLINANKNLNKKKYYINKDFI